MENIDQAIIDADENEDDAGYATAPDLDLSHYVEGSPD
jgi:hypothetical protein